MNNSLQKNLQKQNLNSIDKQEFFVRSFKLFTLESLSWVNDPAAASIMVLQIIFKVIISQHKRTNAIYILRKYSHLL